MVLLVIFSVSISPGPQIPWSLLIGCSSDWIPRTDISWPTLVEPVSLCRFSWVDSRWTSSVGLTVLYLGRWQRAQAFITMHSTDILQHACVIPASTHVTWEPLQVTARDSGNRNAQAGAEAAKGSGDLFLPEVFIPSSYIEVLPIESLKEFLNNYKLLIDNLQV